MTTGKTIALTRWAFVGNVMSLLFNMLSRLVIIFLPRSKSLQMVIAAMKLKDSYSLEGDSYMRSKLRATALDVELLETEQLIGSLFTSNNLPL